MAGVSRVGRRPDTLKQIMDQQTDFSVAALDAARAEAERIEADMDRLGTELAILQRKISLLEEIISLEERHRAGQSFDPNEEENTISRTLGLRVYQFASKFLNEDGLGIASIDKLYAALPSQIRAEFENFKSPHTALYRFRRLLRKKKSDFSVDRSGLVRYLKMAPPRDFGSKWPSPPADPQKAKLGVEVFARRWNAVSEYWDYCYREDGSEHVCSWNQLYSYIKEGKVPFMKRKDGTLVYLSAMQIGADGPHYIETYRNGSWTPDLDYYLPEA